MGDGRGGAVGWGRGGVEWRGWRGGGGGEQDGVEGGGVEGWRGGWSVGDGRWWGGV